MSSGSSRDLCTCPMEPKTILCRKHLFREEELLISQQKFLKNFSLPTKPQNRAFLFFLRRCLNTMLHSRKATNHWGKKRTINQARFWCKICILIWRMDEVRRAAQLDCISWYSSLCNMNVCCGEKWSWCFYCATMNIRGGPALGKLKMTYWLVELPSWTERWDPAMLSSLLFYQQLPRAVALCHVAIQSFVCQLKWHIKMLQQATQGFALQIVIR